ncbi:hypothetical protein [Brevundimonas sp.]|uniref:hypothetical protein n=1 Tax=Brevundimonas sp. TaxID=1871086 RepID=UPI002737B13A|nr:hypothetical protein [Brevundimonas sp.]MDP3802103.1 hypothetical protein [Brevundimonas sp.]
MRAFATAAPAALILVLAGCASTGATGSDNDTVQRLAADCRARGGVLVPSGEATGRPQVDNACRITGGASRLTDGG